MIKFIKNFRKDEDGAVTVDWVVLTAAVVGLAVAAYSSIKDGATGLTQPVRQVDLDGVAAGNEGETVLVLLQLSVRGVVQLVAARQHLVRGVGRRLGPQVDLRVAVAVQVAGGRRDDVLESVEENSWLLL